MNETKSPNQGNKPSTEGSGSDTASAAKISAGTSLGTVGQPAKPQEHSSQSSTLASHTSKPMGGGAGTTGAGSQPQSRGPEHMRHQDKDAGQGIGAHGRGAGGGSRPTQSMSDAGRGLTGQAQEKAGELYEEASERAGELYEQASEWAREKYEQASSWASDTYENRGRYLDQAERYSMRGIGTAGSSVQRFVRENPVLVGVVGLAAGLLLGALLPRTRQEDRTMGRWSDELRDQGMRYARDMTHRGRQFVDEAFADGDPRFASHESEWRQDDQDSRRRGPSGRYQNH